MMGSLMRWRCGGAGLGVLAIRSSESMSSAFDESFSPPQATVIIQTRQSNSCIVGNVEGVSPLFNSSPALKIIYVVHYSKSNSILILVKAVSPTKSSILHCTYSYKKVDSRPLLQRITGVTEA